MLFIYSTVLLLLKMLVEYCDCVNNMPTAAADLLTRLVELLKVGIFSKKKFKLFEDLLISEIFIT